MNERISVTISPGASSLLSYKTTVETPKDQLAINATHAATARDCLQCIELPVLISFLILIVVILIVGILGNAFVVGVVVTDRKLLHSSINLFLLNLALADMGNLIFAGPEAVMVIFDIGWALPAGVCPVIRFLQEYFLYASVLLQMSIGIERYMAICSPLRMQRFTRKTTAYVLVGVWAVAAGFAAPYLIFATTILINRAWLICFVKIPTYARKPFRYSEFFILYAVPLVLLTVLYSIMGKVLWGGRSASYANEAQQMAVLKLRRSVVKMLIISMFIYFVCYSPIQGMFVTEFVLGMRGVHNMAPSWLRMIMNMLPIASSSANPIVYIMCCRHFHSRFCQLMQWVTSCCLNSEHYATVLDADRPPASRTFSRSPYVSFRKSIRRPHAHSLTLL